MSYELRFPNTSIERKFGKILDSVSPKTMQDRIMEAVEGLADNPRPFGEKIFKQIKPPIQFYQYVAQYRLRVGDYRILYDVDDKRKIVWILALRKRNEKTYI